MLIRSFRMLMAGLIAVLLEANAFASSFTLISKDQLKEDMSKSTVQVIDVRTEGDWASSPWKIQGAVREDPNTIDQWMTKYPKEKVIVLYCA